MAKPLAWSSMLVVLIVAALPLLLGPALSPLVRVLAASDHLCACGMIPGTCGCPSCARLERERREAERSPLIRSGCDGDDDAPPIGSLAPCLENPVGVEIPAPKTFTIVRERPLDARSRAPDEPAKPPPKSRVVQSTYA